MIYFVCQIQCPLWKQKCADTSVHTGAPKKQLSIASLLYCSVPRLPVRYILSLVVLCRSSPAKGGERQRRLRKRLSAAEWAAAASKMEFDTAVRRIKPFGTNSCASQDNNGSHEQCGDNGYSGCDQKRKPEVRLYLLRECPATVLVCVFILVLWALVHLSLQQLVIGKPTGDFNAVRARWALTVLWGFFFFWDFFSTILFCQRRSRCRANLSSS